MKKKMNPRNNAKTSEKEGTLNGRKYSNSDKKCARKSKRAGRRFEESNMDRDDSSIIGGNNDFSWYNTLPELTSAAARFPFSRPTGTKTTFSSVYGTANTVANDANLFGNYVPGVMTIHWAPTVGVSTDATSPVNILSREIYSFVRHANSGSANYDSPDLMIYLLAMDSIYSMYTEAVRAYGLINMYTKENRYMPKELITALGYDFEDLKQNTAQFRWFINQIAYKISSFAVPNFMSYYLRHIWMNTGVYLDKDSAKAQMYAFVQDGYYYYQDKIASGNFGGLAFASLRSNIDSKPLTALEWYKIMTEMCRPILASEDFGIMSGDILKAFGNENLFTVSPIPVDVVVVPTYNPEVLTQITNMTIVGRMCTSDEIPLTTVKDGQVCCSDIVQSIDGTTADGYLVTRPTFRTWSTIDPKFKEVNNMYYVTSLDKLITSDAAIPDEADVMVSTRLTNTPIFYTDASGKPFYTFNQDATCSTEVVSSVHVYAFSHNYETKELYLQDNVYTNYGLYTGDSELAWKLTRLSKFDWCPTLPVVSKINENTVQFNGYYQDTNNYAVLDSADLQRLHEAALMSEFYVPQIASASRKPNVSK